METTGTLMTKPRVLFVEYGLLYQKASTSFIAILNVTDANVTYLHKEKE
jgi:hypothetical protein